MVELSALEKAALLVVLMVEMLAERKGGLQELCWAVKRVP